MLMPVSVYKERLEVPVQTAWPELTRRVSTALLNCGCFSLSTRSIRSKRLFSGE